jgi:hypothetical protein
MGSVESRAVRRHGGSAARAHPGTKKAPIGTVIHHAAPVLPLGSVVSLAIAMVQSAFGTLLILAAIPPSQLGLLLNPTRC